MAERGRSQAGLTLIELLVTLAIVAGAIAALQYSASRAYRSAVETNHVRTAKMLLRKKAEEVYAGLETGTGGGFEGYPEAFSWSVSEATAPLDPTGERTSAVVRVVTVEVRYPSLEAAQQETAFDEVGFDDEPSDRPGQMRVTMLLLPPEQEEGR